MSADLAAGIGQRIFMFAGDGRNPDALDTATAMTRRDGLTPALVTP